MRTGSPAHKQTPAKGQEQLQTPDKFIADDFEAEDITPAAKQLGSMWQNDRRLCENERTRSLQWHYDFGTAVAEHYEAVEKERKHYGMSMYGDRFFQRVADAINAESARKVSWQLLHQCYTLVGTYGEEAFEELCQHDEITPSHALYLARIKIDALRTELQTNVVTEKWTVEELYKAHIEKFGPRRKPGAGRPLKTPKHPKAAIVHLTAQAQKFIKANDEIWFGAAFDIPTAVNDMPSSTLTDELKQQLSEAAELCNQLAEKASEKVEVLRGVLADVERRLQLQADHDRRVREESEEKEGERVCVAAV